MMVISCSIWLEKWRISKFQRKFLFLLEGEYLYFLWSAHNLPACTILDVREIILRLTRFECHKNCMVEKKNHNSQKNSQKMRTPLSIIPNTHSFTSFHYRLTVCFSQCNFIWNDPTRFMKVSSAQFCMSSMAMLVFMSSLMPTNSVLSIHFHQPYHW